MRSKMHVVHLKWLLFAFAATVFATEGAAGSSLRGALEALQRRQRGPTSRQFEQPTPDYRLGDNYGDYDEAPYQRNYEIPGLSLDNDFETPEENYIIKYLRNTENPKSLQNNQKTSFRERLANNQRVSREMNKRKRSSAFRERVHNTNENNKDENEMFLNKFFDNDIMDIDQPDTLDAEDKEYAELLDHLWKKYKLNHKFPEVSTPSDQVIWLYKDINNRKRQFTDNYATDRALGPVAFKKRKRNVAQYSNVSNNNSRGSSVDLTDLKEIEDGLSGDEMNINEYPKALEYNELPPYDISDSYNPDLTEEIGIAFQPFDNRNIEYFGNEDISNSWNNPIEEKRFPITKRSNGDISKNNRQFKTDNQYNTRTVRGSWGTNPKVLKDLSDIFGKKEPNKKLNIKKRSQPLGDFSHSNHDQTKSPQISAMSHNFSYSDANNSKSFVDETDNTNIHQHAPHANKHTYDIAQEEIEKNWNYRQNNDVGLKSNISEKKKRSFKWSDYFGIDKRQKKSVPIDQNIMKDSFLDIFRNEMANQINTFQEEHVTKTSLNSKQSSANDGGQHLYQTIIVPHNTKGYQLTNIKNTSKQVPVPLSKNMQIITISQVSVSNNKKEQQHGSELTTELNKPLKFKREINNMYSFAQLNPFKQFNPRFNKRSQDNLENEEINDFNLDKATILSITEKREPKRVDPIRLENMDNKLKNLEIDVVDEASNFGENSDGLDSKEEQEMRERILSRLAAAYSLEKMRKALKEFKHSIESQKHTKAVESRPNKEQTKEKKVFSQNDISHTAGDKDKLKSASTKSLNTADTTLDKFFEAEQGAGQFSNGEVDVQFSEGYMGGSGRRDEPDTYEGANNSNCPSLDNIVTKCKRVDALAGDHAHVFLPLCSLHQICYICGTLSQTSCDLIFISEADTLCENKTECLQAARNSIMMLRELYESMADNLDGECENNPCLRRVLKYSPSWWNRD